MKRSSPLNMRLPDTTVCDQHMKLFVHLTEFKPALTFTVKSYLLIHSLVEILLTLWPPKVISMNFSLQYHARITHEGYENNKKDRQLMKLLIVKQIPLVSTLGIVKRTVWRICILMLGCKGLSVTPMTLHIDKKPLQSQIHVDT